MVCSTGECATLNRDYVLRVLAARVVICGLHMAWVERAIDPTDSIAMASVSPVASYLGMAALSLPIGAMMVGMLCLANDAFTYDRRRPCNKVSVAVLALSGVLIAATGLPHLLELGRWHPQMAAAKLLIAQEPLPDFLLQLLLVTASNVAIVAIRLQPLGATAAAAAAAGTCAAAPTAAAAAAQAASFHAPLVSGGGVDVAELQRQLLVALVTPLVVLALYYPYAMVVGSKHNPGAASAATATLRKPIPVPRAMKQPPPGYKIVSAHAAGSLRSLAPPALNCPSLPASLGRHPADAP